MKHILLSREAIIDGQSRTIGYEIDFNENAGALFHGGEKTHAEAVVQSVESISTGKQAFLDFSREMLRKKDWRKFPKSSTVIEVQADLLGEKVTQQSCFDVKAEGYRLALAGYRNQASCQAMLPEADYVKVDHADIPGAEMEKYLKQISTTRLITCNVNRPEERTRLQELGAVCYQGSFFKTLPRKAPKTLPSSKTAKIQLLEKFSRPDFDFQEAENIIKHDPDLSLKLLKYVNSAALGVRYDVRGIRQAMALIGLANLQVWSSLLVVSNLSDDHPGELLRQIITRGRFCEMLAEPSRQRNQASDLFLVGMFSLLDATLGIPMDRAIQDLPLTSEIRDTLLGEQTTLQPILELVRAFEGGDWNLLQEYADRLGLEESQLAEINLQAILWAEHFSEE